jgi:hypothetical protein
MDFTSFVPVERYQDDYRVNIKTVKHREIFDQINS